jgi:hypothetical protein
MMIKESQQEAKERERMEESLIITEMLREVSDDHMLLTNYALSLTFVSLYFVLFEHVTCQSGSSSIST